MVSGKWSMRERFHLPFTIIFFKELHLDVIEELVEHPNDIFWTKDIIKLNKGHRK